MVLKIRSLVCKASFTQANLSGLPVHFPGGLTNVKDVFVYTRLHVICHKQTNGDPFPICLADRITAP